MVRRLFSLVVLVLAAAACSGGAATQTASGGPVGGGSSVELGGDGYIVTKDGKRTKVAYPSPSPLPSSLKATPGGAYQGKDGRILVDFVKVEVPEHESWAGETCAPPKRGGHCKVPFQGAVHSVGAGNVIVLMAFENGNFSKPAATLRISAEQGMTRIDHWMPYQVGPKTTRVTFRTELQTKDGKVLAKSFEQNWGIFF